MPAGGAITYTQHVYAGAKRLAEMMCQSLQDGGTQFVIVRFGNVFGSAGSVIPRFREQIARGGPVTVTHPEITRYFMSLSEATQLLLQAGLPLQGLAGEILPAGRERDGGDVR